LYLCAARAEPRYTQPRFFIGGFFRVSAIIIIMSITDILKTAAATCVMAVSIFAAPSAVAQTAKGEKAFGPRIGFVARNESALGGLAFQYSFSRHVRIAPSADIIFRHRDMDGFAVNADVQFPFAFATGRAAFYPLAGFSFTSWGLHGNNADSGKDVTTHSTSAGLNAGAGIEFRCTQTLKLAFEARYTLMRHYPTTAVAASIAYVF